MDKKRERMKELTELLTKAGKAYYQESREIMSNFEYDKLYDELSSLEQETGMTSSRNWKKRPGSSWQEVRPDRSVMKCSKSFRKSDTSSRCFLLTRQKKSKC